jgi:hypothetical protein
MKEQTKFKIALMIFIIGLYLVSFVQALDLTSFNVNPDQVAPGKTADIFIFLKNNGDYDAEDVSVSLDLTSAPIAPYNSGIQFNQDIIDSGENKRVDFQVIVLNDAKAGIYKIPVVVKYTEDGQTKTFNSLISITINSEPILQVDSEDGLLLKGQQNKLTVKIINKGLADVRFLEINLGGSSYYNILSSNKVYIGDVDSNDFQTTDYNIFFKDSSLTNVDIPVTINYKDITGKEYTQNSVISSKVYSQNEAISLGLVQKSYTVYIVVIIVVLVLIFIIYRLIRNRRSKREPQ